MSKKKPPDSERVPCVCNRCEIEFEDLCGSRSSQASSRRLSAPRTSDLRETKTSSPVILARSGMLYSYRIQKCYVMPNPLSS